MGIRETVLRLYQTERVAFITGMFQEFLNRQPSPRILARLLKEMDNGQSKESLFEKFIGSEGCRRILSSPPKPQVFKVLQEIYRKNGFEFVKRFFKEVYGREPSLLQLQQGEAFVHAEGKMKFIRDILLREENTERISKASLLFESTLIRALQNIFLLEGDRFAVQLSQELLGHESIKDLPKGQTKIEVYKKIIQSKQFEELLHRDDPQSCMESIYRLMRYDDWDFITELHQECLQREPESVEFAHYIRLIKGGKVSRYDLLKEMVLRGEGAKRYSLRQATRQSPPETEGSIPWPSASVSSHFRKNVEETLRNHHLPFETTLLLSQGGMGDCIQLTPVAKALKEKYPGRPVVAIVESYSSIFDKHPYVDLAIEYREQGLRSSRVVLNSIIGVTENMIDLCFYVSRSYGKWRNTPYFNQNRWFYYHFPGSGSRVEDLNKHICDVMLHSLGLEKYATSEYVSIVPDSIPERIPGDYVVVCNSTGSVAGHLKEWARQEWEGLIRWLRENGVIPVQLGAASEMLLHPDVLDLRGKTTPRQAAAYLQSSKGYIGVEGGLFHLSKAVGVPAVVVFTSTSPICYMYRDTRVVTKRECHPCWWTDSWRRGICLRNTKPCLNSPDWQTVSVEVANMLKK